jgi:FixJ family two-component response regulator
MIALRVTGELTPIDTPPDMPLLWALHDVLRPTGTKPGGSLSHRDAGSFAVRSSTDVQNRASRWVGDSVSTAAERGSAARLCEASMNTASFENPQPPDIREGAMEGIVISDFKSAGVLATRWDPELRSAPMSHAKPVVFVVDDDISVRESLEALIRFEGWEPKTYTSAQEFLACPALPGPSCLVLDVNLPDLNGLELQKRVAAGRADLPIIFITGQGDIPMTVQAMKAGAIEFLTKPFGDDVLLGAIRQALERSSAALERGRQTQLLRDRHGSLSRREQEVMALVVSGLLNKQIAFQLGISEITVKAHRGQVMRKMKARSLPDLVKMAARLGMVRRDG